MVIFGILMLILLLMVVLVIVGVLTMPGANLTIA
jgi:hypothetical protein